MQDTHKTQPSHSTKRQVREGQEKKHEAEPVVGQCLSNFLEPLLSSAYFILFRQKTNVMSCKFECTRTGINSSDVQIET